MAEIISSAVAQETVGQILSGLVHKYEGKGKSNADENLERLEMAHIKLEAALETSDKWLISDASLLRWRRKLMCAARECHGTLHKWKQRISEDELMEQEIRGSSLPKQIVHATKSFISSIFSHNNDEPSRSLVRRFEWYADGASEFLRFVELGGTPRCYMPFGSLIRHLLAGKQLHHRIVQGTEYPLLLLWLVPFCAEQGTEAGLIFTLEDCNAPENNFFFSVMLQISESTDIVAIVMRCLQLYPHFKSTTEIIKKELTQLPTMDFAWVPYVDSCQKKHFDNVYSFSTEWFRPNPLCCKQHDRHKLCHGSRLDKSGLPDVSLEPSGLPDVSLEPVIEVNLQCHVLMSKYNKQRTSLSEIEKSLQDSPYLRVGLVFTPHGSSEDTLPVDRSSAVAAIHCLHTDVTLGQVEEIMLPKAMDYFSQGTEATVHQMLWKSKHGTAYLQVEKGSIFMPSTWRTFPGARKRKLSQRKDEELGSWAQGISYFLNFWATHAPIQLQGSVTDWIQKEKEMQLAPPPLRLKY